MAITNAKPLPVGRRPKCLSCGKELHPNFETFDPPYELWSNPQKTAAWRKAHPKLFRGTYGSYGDNRFCGLNCGYKYALKISGPVR